MQPKQRRYILENIGKKPIREIAQDLKLKERQIRKFLEGQSTKGQIQKPNQQAITHPPQKAHTAVSLCLIALFGFILYANSLNGKFIWDDVYLIENNAYIHEISSANIRNIFTKNILDDANEGLIFYRPVQMLSYMLDYSLWRFNVFGYHLTNVLLHILVALCVYFLISFFYTDHLLALFTALLFAACPLHAEAVAYISGRADLLASLFALLCFLAYIASLRFERIFPLIMMPLFYAIAIFSRENSLVLIGAFLFFNYMFKKKANLKAFLPIIAVSLSYLAIRWMISGSLFPPAAAITFPQRIAGFFAALASYISLLLLPFPLHMEYGTKIFSWNSFPVVIGLILFAFLAAFFRKEIRKKSQAALSIGWFFIFLLPQANLYPVNAYMAEHWLYLPSIGFCLLGAKLFVYLWRAENLKKLAFFSLTAALIYYSFLTIRQNRYWQNPITFYEKTLAHAPRSSRLYNMLAIAYIASGRNKEAAEASKKAITSHPEYYKAYNTLATAYMNMGQNEEALRIYLKALDVNPNYPEAYFNNGILYQKIGKINEAVASYQKAIALRPNYTKAYLNLGNALSEINRIDESIAAYEKAITLNPKDGCLYNNLALIYFQAKKYGRAIEFSEKAKQLGVLNPALLKDLQPYRS